MQVEVARRLAIDAFNADLVLLAQSGRALLRRPDSRAGSFASVNQLVSDINVYLTQRNPDPKPYIWLAEGAHILAKIKRARAPLDKAVTA
jgi:hypothetical protein